MNIRTLLAAVLLAAANPLHAEQESQGSSDSGKLRWELKKAGQDGVTIWLSGPEGSPAAPVKLCETEGWGNLQMHIAPDDNWIIVQDGGGSLGIHIRLFKRTKGLNFAVQERDIEGEMEKLAWKSAGLPAQNILDHQYTRVIAWSPDSKSVLLRTAGHGGKKRIRGFTAVYDLGAGTFSFDLAKMNAGAAGAENE
jgi:hypothetical protein